MGDYSDTEEDVGILIAVKDAALKPLSFAVSRRARRAYLSTALFIITALVLLGIAATAYVTFYLSYVPIRGFTQPVYFQFDAGLNPYAHILLRKGHLVTDQPYDVTVSLHLPRTPVNTAAGNFMIDLQLLAPTSTSGRPKDEPVILARERRPAILTYYSPLIEYLHKLISLPLYVLGWRKEEERIELLVMEGVEFSRGGRQTPISARLELSNAPHMQIYNAAISFKTKLRGLRYLMYNWRLTSFVVFTSIFWGVEVTFTAAFWFCFSMLLSSRDEPSGKTKENEKTSIKNETEIAPEENVLNLKQEEADPSLQDYPTATEADVEDEEEPDLPVMVGSSHLGAPSDSGLGTSLDSSSTKRDTVRRRSSKPTLD